MSRAGGSGQILGGQMFAPHVMHFKQDRAKTGIGELRVVCDQMAELQTCGPALGCQQNVEHGRHQGEDRQ